jgi:II/X family phage/plasmid replication protein
LRLIVVAYDTIKLRSPAMSESMMQRIEAQCILRSGLDLGSGAILYELFTGELLGSWDARISVLPKREEWCTEADGRPRLRPCMPYLLVEASAHKVMQGHNVYGGPEVFGEACRAVVHLVEDLLNDGREEETEGDGYLGRITLAPTDQWTVHRVDVASVFRLRKEACKEFFDGLQLLSFPRRQRGASKYAMAVHFAGKTTCVKLYHKGSEFAVHDRSRLRSFFRAAFAHQYGKGDPKNGERADKKVAALQRLADSRLRVEVEIHSDKFQYDLGRNPRVEEVSDEYLQRIYDGEIERLLREGKQGMATVRNDREVLRRLEEVYGEKRGKQLHGVWLQFTTWGDDRARAQFPRETFRRHRKALEEAGVSWRHTNIVAVANDGALPATFAPVRTDHRLCFLPARNRPEFNISREQMRLAA